MVRKAGYLASWKTRARKLFEAWMEKCGKWLELTE
jgi:hypothetical protein